ncbi:MAG: glycosyltransferase family 2 protein [Bacteroidota bacterium]
MLKFGLIVPTLNAGSEWLGWLDAFNGQTCKPDKMVVIDSSSTDKTRSFSKDNGFTVELIGRDEFNHGGTRQYGLSFLGNVDVVVFLTQDANLSSVDSLCQILEPFHDSRVGAVCGRQLPRRHATPVEAHARLYNYSSEAFSRSIKDINKFGLKTAFISNSFAAYRISALNKVGGFPEDVIFGEDMYVATKLLMVGYEIAYAADACVYHSHDYSLWQEMKRYFDMGVFHAREPWIRQELGGAEGEGVKFVVSELKYLLKHAFWQIPEALLRTLLRYTGFRLGLMEKRLPLSLKRVLAMNKGAFKR